MSEAIHVGVFEQTSGRKGLFERPVDVRHFLAGGVAAGVGDIFAHGIDTTKTRMQVTEYKSTYEAISHIRKEGMRGFYRGFAPAMTGSISSHMLYFGLYHHTKMSLLNHFNHSPIFSSLSQSRKDTLAFFIGGCVGDLAASFFYVPMEVVKTRMQIRGSGSVNYNYKSMFSALRIIYRNEGFVNGLYAGYKATLFRDIPFSAIQFVLYEKLKILFQSFRDDSFKNTWQENMVAGGLAGGLAGFLTTPLDVIKTHLQTKTVPGLSQQNFGLFRSSFFLYKTLGFSGLFRGVLPRVLWTAPQCGCMFFMYEIFLEKLSCF